MNNIILIIIIIMNIFNLTSLISLDALVPGNQQIFILFTDTNVKVALFLFLTHHKSINQVIDYFILINQIIHGGYFFHKIRKSRQIRKLRFELLKI